MSKVRIRKNNDYIHVQETISTNCLYLTIIKLRLARRQYILCEAFLNKRSIKKNVACYSLLCLVQGPICEDCEEELKPDLNKSSEVISDNMADTEFLCRKCEARRVERKETIQEIADTEVSYGKDLKIIKEVCSLLFIYFFSPILLYLHKCVY